MVKIAVAGGSGQVSREVIDALVAAKKHEITILSRSNPNTRSDIAPEITWRIVDYNDKGNLMEALRGVHTLLSFIQLLSDPDQKAQKNLIDAAIAAGVKRFAPSEYGSKETVNMPFMEGKEKIREYLRKANEKEDVIEYTLFQPGIFLDYLAFPHKTSKHVEPLQTVFDIQNKRAIVVAGHEDAIMTLTTAADLAAIVARAVDYDGKWPVNGGIRGNRVTYSQIIEIGERVRGEYDFLWPDASYLLLWFTMKEKEKVHIADQRLSHTGQPFTVEKVQLSDLEAGELKTSWALEAVHPAVSPAEAAAMLKIVSIGILLSSTKGAWDVSDDMSALFPDHQFARIEDFLEKVWGGKAE